MRNRVLCLIAASLAGMSGCAKKEVKEAEPIVPVQVTAVRQDSIRRIVTADAVLFARDWSNVMSKISAPVRKFYVNRGDHVAQGQVVAEPASNQRRRPPHSSNQQVHTACAS